MLLDIVNILIQGLRKTFFIFDPGFIFPFSPGGWTNLDLILSDMAKTFSLLSLDEATGKSWVIQEGQKQTLAVSLKSVWGPGAQQ